MVGGHEGDGETSVDSLMEDTPANYNIPNQRFEDNYDDYEPIPEETHGRERRDRSKDRKQRATVNQSDTINNLEMSRIKKKKTKKVTKKKKQDMLEYLMPTKREINMADAYGGNAKGQFRRPGVKYDKERLMNRIKTPANIPGGRAQLEALANTVAGFNAKKLPIHSIPDNLSARGSRPPMDHRNNFMEAHNRSEFQSNDGIKNLNNSMQYSRADAMMGAQKKSTGQINRSRSNLPRHGKLKNQTGNFNEVDFEKVLGKDIDQFLEDSEWDIESYGKMSQYSRGGSARANSHDQRIKHQVMEKVYMQRFEKEHESVGAGTAKNSHTTGPTTNAKRKYIPRDPERFNESNPFNKVSEFEGKRDNSNSRSPPRAQPRNSFPEDRPKPIGARK